MKTVLHYKQTKIAFAPDELVKCINKYSKKYNAVLFADSKKCLDNIPIVQSFDGADIIHCHNRIAITNCKNIIMQYHSPVSYVDTRHKYKELVVAQYQAGLKEYKRSIPVRNIIDIYDDQFIPHPIDNIKIGFSPSTKYDFGNKSYESKGYPETAIILERLKQKHGIDFDIIYNAPLTECIERKSKCSIIIDECITDSYHRSGLEGLALGKLTICSLGNKVINILQKTSGSNTVPFENIWINQLESYLLDLVSRKDAIEYIRKKGEQNREWMETFWNPVDVLNDYEKIYDGIKV